jgi:hypothetical protein
MKDKKATREQAKEDRLIQQQLQRELKGQEKETKNNRKACILAKSVVVVPLPTAEGTDSVPKGGRPRRVKRMPNHLHDYDL